MQAAERQNEGLQQEEARGQQQLQQARLELQQAQNSRDEVQQQSQEWQDQAHQAASQLQVYQTAALPLKMQKGAYLSCQLPAPRLFLVFGWSLMGQI